MKLFLLKIFTWWNGQTFGTQLWTWRFGALVGEAEQGNRYYRTKGGAIDPSLGFERRWVIYNGYAEASRVPPSWHGWLHHMVDVPPTAEAYTPPEWETPACADPGVRPARGRRRPVMRRISHILLGAVIGAGFTAVATQPPSALVAAARAAASSDTYSHLNLLGDVFERIKAGYVERPDD